MIMKKAKKYLLNILLLLISLFGLLPFYFMFILSTNNTEDIYKGLVILPRGYILQNLKTVFESNFLAFYWNSIYVAVLSTVLCTMISALTGFAFAKYRFKGRDGLYNFILMTMMIPTQLGLVAYIIQMKTMGLNKTHLPLIIQWGASAFGVFWMNQYIRSNVPTEVIESARIDGCNELRTFISIVIPYIKPALVTLSILVFMWSWNNYLLPVVIINKPGMYTIPLGIATLGNLYRNDYAAKIMGLSLGTLPAIIIFIAGSRSFIRGITAGAVKG